MPTIDTEIRDLTTGEARTVEQTVELHGAELVYTVEGGGHEVRVNAERYVAMLVDLTGWKPDPYDRGSGRDRIA